MALERSCWRGGRYAFGYLTLFLDGDSAGRAASAQIGMRLVLSGKHWVRVVELADGEQPDRLSSEKIRNLLGVE